MSVPMRHRMAAFSLIELMVSMTLSLILLAAAMSILYSTKLTSAENERVARIQEAGRTAFELIKQDARGSGYAGCARPHVDATGTSYSTTGLNNASLLWDFSKPVYGFEAKPATWSPALDPVIPASPAAVKGSDILVLRTARPGAPLFRTNTAITATTLAADISVDRDAAASLTTPTIMIIGDCIKAEVFIATGLTPTGGGATATIAHAAGGAPVGNSSASLTNSYRQGALLQPVQTVIYYVASCTAVDGPAGPCTALTPPALWQISTDQPSGGKPQELIQGVELMQLKYGVDNDQDFLANTYMTAEAVNAVPYWSNVVSVNIAILVRSIDETGKEKDTQQYKLLDTTLPAFNDRRNRAVFTTTISLRNDTT